MAYGGHQQMVAPMAYGGHQQMVAPMAYGHQQMVAPMAYGHQQMSYASHAPRYGASISAGPVTQQLLGYVGGGTNMNYMASSPIVGSHMYQQPMMPIRMPMQSYRQMHYTAPMASYRVQNVALQAPVTYAAPAPAPVHTIVQASAPIHTTSTSQSWGSPITQQQFSMMGAGNLF